MSVFKKITAKFYVDLAQYYIGELKKAARLEVTSRLLKYDPILKGTIISFSKVMPISKDEKQLCSFVYADSPFVHIQMQAEFLVFKPYPGCLLPATVAYSTSSALSLIIFDYFQGTVDLNEHKKDWSFQQGKWYRGSESITENDVVVVRVTDVQPNTDGVTIACIIEKKSDIPPQEISKPEENDENAD
ncbi:DNA-directed RNA polymerase I subunit RPA43 [Histomonas meleagridis]|uniref:DNA-directed RNA polymerase I subunit RPA43 n=1 Tax=Histomonas meleagridis TaxID=135588 RepID=UPI003559CB02|nr:DNA-directed RNA polymerase I subunit RPA43 [Histomonas meleagridis]KAH0802296.1 DNA-directed RNA polymerase I subunit RPA43 [Histomonas meleagridis]